MAKYKITKEMCLSLSSKDQEVLCGIYQHRCLTRSLIHRFYYKKSHYTKSMMQSRLERLCTFGYLEPQDYGKEEPAYFLTTLGVAMVRELLDIPIRYLDPDTEEWKHTPKAYDLKMNYNSIHHQMHLNEFALTFESYAKENANFAYYDGKFMPPASRYMMPDAMIELPHMILVLEMDMGTENSQKLAKKWDSYLTFLRSPQEHYYHKPVVMLFILDGILCPEKRKKTIMRSLSQYLLPYISEQFEVYVGSPAELHEVIKYQLLFFEKEDGESDSTYIYRELQQRHQFTLASPEILQTLQVPFGAYIRMLDDSRQLVTMDGRIQEFMIDLWLDKRISVFHNMTDYSRLTKHIESQIGRTIPYLVVVPDEKELFEVLTMLSFYYQENLFFTTPKRLHTLPFEQALFQVDALGNLYNYTDRSYTHTVFERRIYRKK